MDKRRAPSNSPMPLTANSDDGSPGTLTDDGRWRPSLLFLKLSFTSRQLDLANDFVLLIIDVVSSTTATDAAVAAAADVLDGTAWLVDTGACALE